MKLIKKVTGIMLCVAVVLSATACKRGGYGKYGGTYGSSYSSSTDDSFFDSGLSDDGQDSGHLPIEDVVDDMSVFEMVEDMKIGWNLGNTFDASDCTWLTDEMQYESAWNGEMTREEHIQMLKDTGFNAVRIPVSWHNHVDGNYKISQAWLERVAQVVDWCLSRDMYVILNIHHDNSQQFMYPSNQYIEQSKTYVSEIWKQLSERFKNYSHKLVFESLNEPRLVGHNNEWWIDPYSNDCKEAILCINELNQVFVDTVRASGGNNATRYLMCPGYDASSDGALNDGYVIPNDPVSQNRNRIIVTVHAYVPYDFALNENGTNYWSASNKNDTDGVTVFMDNLYTKFISKGTAVIIDEFGARDKNGNLSARTEFAEYYVKAAREHKITCFWWDNNAFESDGENFGLLDRASNTWKYESIVSALIENS